MKGPKGTCPRRRESSARCVVVEGESAYITGRDVCGGCERHRDFLEGWFPEPNRDSRPETPTLDAQAAAAAIQQMGYGRLAEALRSGLAHVERELGELSLYRMGIGRIDRGPAIELNWTGQLHAALDRRFGEDSGWFGTVRKIIHPVRSQYMITAGAQGFQLVNHYFESDVERNPDRSWMITDFVDKLETTLADLRLVKQPEHRRTRPGPTGGRPEDFRPDRSPFYSWDRTR